MKFKRIVILFVAIAILCIVAVPIVQAQGLKEAFNVKDDNNKDNVDAVAVLAGYDTTKTDLVPVIGSFIQPVLSLLGVVFMVLTLYGGFLWMTAKGDEAQVTKSKNVLTAAVIGLIIVLSSYAISYFVVSNLGSTTLQEVSVK